MCQDHVFIARPPVRATSRYYMNWTYEWIDAYNHVLMSGDDCYFGGFYKVVANSPVCSHAAAIRIRNHLFQKGNHWYRPQGSSVPGDQCYHVDDDSNACFELRLNPYSFKPCEAVVESPLVIGLQGPNLITVQESGKWAVTARGANSDSFAEFTFRWYINEELERTSTSRCGSDVFEYIASAGVSSFDVSVQVERNGSQKTESVNVLVSDCEITPCILGSDEFMNHMVEVGSVYPNPSIGEALIDIRLTSDALVSLTLFDLLSRAVYDKTEALYASGDHVIVIPVSEVSAGTYIVKVTAESVELRETVVMSRLVTVVR